MRLQHPWWLVLVIYWLLLWKFNSTNKFETDAKDPHCFLHRLFGMSQENIRALRCMKNVYLNEISKKKVKFIT